MIELYKIFVGKYDSENEIIEWITRKLTCCSPEVEVKLN